MEVVEAVKALAKALREDEQYRYSWQANIAMFTYDAIRREPDAAGWNHETYHRACNAGAIEFLRVLAKA